MHEQASRMADGNWANSLKQAVMYLDGSRPARNGTEAYPMIASVNYLYKLTNCRGHQCASNSWVMKTIYERKFGF